MRVVVLGASGNVGTSVLSALQAEPKVSEVIGIARRRPDLAYSKVRWEVADIAESDLVSHFRGADAVVHCAWLIQPSRDESLLERVNIHGTERVLAAVKEAGVKTLVYASSVGAYSKGPKQPAVKESWPTGGIPEHYYCRQKAEVEGMLDGFETAVPGVRVVRMRMAFVFKREAATGIRRLFMGPLFPTPLLRAGLIRVVPNIKGLAFQAVHSLDAGEAYRLAIVSDARGAFNIAAEPLLTMKSIADLLGAWSVPMPEWMALRAMKAAWITHLIPSPATWLKAGLELPIMDVERARRELGWRPLRTAMEAVADLIDGLKHSDGLETPPLDPATSGPMRMRELLTGVGSTDR